MSDERNGIGLYEAQQVLGLSERSLRSWLHVAKIKPAIDQRDARRKILSFEQIARLRLLQNARKERRSMNNSVHRGQSDDFSRNNQKFAAIVASYGPFAPWARQVLHRACDMSAGHPLHTLHVMLAALRVSWPEEETQGNTRVLESLLTVPTIRSAYESALASALTMRSNVQPSEADKNVSDALRNILIRVRVQVAPGQHISFPVLASTILEADGDVKSVFSVVPDEVAIPINQLIEDLHWLDKRERAYIKFDTVNISDLLSIVSPCDGHRHARRHNSLAGNVLRALSTRRPSELVVCAGFRGSPMSRLDHILADLFDEGNYLAWKDSLHHLTKVFTLNIGSLRLQGAAAGAMLAEAIKHAGEEGAALLLDRFELLRENNEINTAILRTLAAPTQAAVVARFWLNHAASKSPAATFPDLTLRIVESDPYSPEQTLNVIRDHYGDFIGRGFPVEPYALETLFALEPCIYEDEYRKTLPYLAIELLKDTIETISVERQGSTGFLFTTTAKTAVDTLEFELLRSGGEMDHLGRVIQHYNEEAHQRNAQELEAFCHSWAHKIVDVMQANQELSALRDAPWTALPTHSPQAVEIQPVPLTRALVNMQLFGSRTYKFPVKQLEERFKQEFIDRSANGSI